MSRILYIVNSGHEEGWHRHTALSVDKDLAESVAAVLCRHME